MAFSTKLNLDNSKFEQQTGSTLNLNGNNIIGNNGDFRYNTQPNFTGSTQVVTKQYVDDNIVSGTSGLTYSLQSPAAIDVGGIIIGTILTGKTSNQILEELLVPTLFPSLTAPSVILQINSSNASLTREVGETETFTYDATFNRGSITPAYSTSGFRSGLPTGYTFTGISADTVITSSLTAQVSVVDYEIQAGANNQQVSVDHEAGEQPLDSKGGNFSTPLAAGTVSDNNNTPNINGIYPIFYGTSASKPTAGSALLAGSTKVVSSSTGTVTIPFNTSGAEFTWMAIPATSTNKTRWFVTELSQGNIATSSPTSDKYVRTDNVSVNSPTTLWSGINYDFYISEGSAIDTTVQFRNS